jgi:FkbM family methyltransferase
MLNQYKKIVKKNKISTKIYLQCRWRIHIFVDEVGTRFWRRRRVVTAKLGFQLASGLHPAYEQMRKGTFELEETSVFEKLMSKNVVFCDIGANLGYYTCMALQRCSYVLAFEPQQQNLECLFQNLSINNFKDRIEIFPIALSEKPGVLELYGASGPSASLIRDWAGYSSSFKQTVPVSTLDLILGERFNDQQILIKIDVEGAEYHVLRGALQTIKRKIRPYWLVEVCFDEFHPSGVNPDFSKIFHLFWDCGYSAYTAQRDSSLVTQALVEQWTSRQSNKPSIFNYVFVDKNLRFNEITP